MYLITVTGFWNDTREQFEYLAQVGGEVDPAIDDQVFYYFDTDETIIGDHGAFTVTGYELA